MTGISSQYDNALEGRMSRITKMKYFFVQNIKNKVTS